MGVGYSYSTQGEMLLNDQLILSDNHRVLKVRHQPHTRKHTWLVSPPFAYAS